MGSIILIVSAKLEVPFYIIQLEALFISSCMIIAFYMLLATATFRSQYPAPFIFGTVFYWSIVMLLLFLVVNILKLNWVERGSGKDSWDLYWQRKARGMKLGDVGEI
ncbi:hypothetical protein BDW67DRAFT_168855 [Aspergillus spinulosporus]